MMNFKTEKSADVSLKPSVFLLPGHFFYELFLNFTDNSINITELYIRPVGSFDNVTGFETHISRFLSLEVHHGDDEDRIRGHGLHEVLRVAPVPVDQAVHRPCATVPSLWQLF